MESSAILNALSDALRRQRHRPHLQRAAHQLLHHPVMAHGEEELNHGRTCNIAGEIANTVSDNARRELGGDFMNSVPIALEGRANQMLPFKVIRS